MDIGVSVCVGSDISVGFCVRAGGVDVPHALNIMATTIIKVVHDVLLFVFISFSLPQKQPPNRCEQSRTVIFMISNPRCLSMYDSYIQNALPLSSRRAKNGTELLPDLIYEVLSRNVLTSVYRRFPHSTTHIHYISPSSGNYIVIEEVAHP